MKRIVLRSTRLAEVVVVLVLTAAFSLYAVQGQATTAKEITADYPEGAEITDFLEFMRKIMGPVISILPGPKVAGKIKPIYLKATPEVVLDKVLTANGFNYEWNKKDNVIIVYRAKMQKLTPSNSKVTKEKTIAIFPFDNLTQDEEFVWLGIGIFMTLYGKLDKAGLALVEIDQVISTIKELKLPSPGSINQATVVKIGRSMGADILIIGALQKSGESLRIIVGLVSTETGKPTKAFEETVSMQELETFAPQNRLATKILKSQGIEMTEKVAQEIEKNPTKNFVALKWFIKGHAAKKGMGMPVDLDLAINYFAKAIKLDPEFTAAYNDRGNIYKQKGEYDQAISDYSKALKMNPDLAEACYNRGNVYALRSEYDQAISDFSHALKINPNSAGAYRNRGNVYFEKGNYDQAISDYNQAIKIDPDLAEAYDIRAIAHYVKGNYDQAWKDIKQCQKLGGQPSPKVLEILRKHSGTSCSVGKEAPLSSLIDGNWESDKFIYDSKTYSYKYLRITESEDYSLVRRPSDNYEDNIIMVLKDFVYYRNILDLEKLKEFIVKNDFFHSLPQDKIRTIFSKKRSNWKMTHIVEFDKFIIVRCTTDQGEKTDIVALSTFSREDGRWKVNIVNEEVKRVRWFKQLLFDKKINLP